MYKQKGFSVLEIILVITIVGLVSAVVWLFINNQPGKETTQTPPQPSKPQSANSPATTADPTADWLTFTPTNKPYSIKFADGWTMHIKSGSSEASLYSTGSLALHAGTKATVDHDLPDIAGCDTIVLDYLDYAWPDKYKSTSATILTTASGLQIEKTITPDELGISGGDKSYGYVGTVNNKTVQLSYTPCKNSPDHHGIIEQVVKTLRIE